MRLDALGQIFVVRLVMRPKYKDGLKTHYSSKRMIFVVCLETKRVIQLDG